MRSSEFRVDPVFVANDPAGLRGALLCGEGLMLANDVMVKPYVEGGIIRRVLPGWVGPEYELNALFPRGRVQSPKVRAFVDFLVEHLNFDADYMQLHCPGNKMCPDEAAALAAKVARDATASALEGSAEPVAA